MTGVQTCALPILPINDISFAIEKYYRQNITSDKLKQKTRELEKTVNKKLTREIKKLAILKEELLEAENREIFKIYADVLSANSHLIQKGAKIFSGLVDEIGGEARGGGIDDQAHPRRRCVGVDLDVVDGEPERAEPPLARQLLVRGVPVADRKSVGRERV